MNVIDMLNKLAIVISGEITNINKGGCAVFASHVAYHLKYNHGMKDVVLRTGWNGDKVNIDKVRKGIPSNSTSMEWNDVGIHFGHVIVEFKHRGKKYHYDAHAGVIKSQRKTVLNNYPLYAGSMTLEEGLQIASSDVGWNSQFNRKQIPKVIKIINSHLLTQMVA